MRGAQPQRLPRRLWLGAETAVVPLSIVFLPVLACLYLLPFITPTTGSIDVDTTTRNTLMKATATTSVRGQTKNRTLRGESLTLKHNIKYATRQLGTSLSLYLIFVSIDRERSAFVCVV